MLSTMLSATEFEHYRAIQGISKQVLQDLSVFIRPDLTERQIYDQCVNLFAQRGITETWYHGVIALVFVGDRTVASMSGRDYQTTDTLVRDQDLVTVDVSPMQNGYWSDYARSFIVGGPSPILQEGIAAENAVHEILLQVAKPQMTFAELNTVMQAKIVELGYRNLDFKGTLGHTIEHDIDARIYITPGEQTRLRDVNLFTFEPHIQALPEGPYGFRREDIYYFAGDRLKALL